jgi:hypothetical protein
MNVDREKAVVMGYAIPQPPQCLQVEPNIFSTLLGLIRQWERVPSRFGPKLLLSDA